jgi:hypothetical protein
MSDTPETDAESGHPRDIVIDADREGYDAPNVVDADFARRLERERDEARRLAEAHKKLAEHYGATGIPLLPWED